MRYTLRTVTAYSAIPLPFTLAEAKVHLRANASDTSEDTLITSQIRAAMSQVELYTGQILTVRTMEIALDGFPTDAIDIPPRPVNSITSLKYTNTDGAEVTLAGSAYRWAATAPNVLFPALDTVWPTAYDETGSVRLQFSAGYASGEIPFDLIASVKVALTALYEGRAGEVAFQAARDVADPYRPVF